MNWGYKIMFVYIAFVIGILLLVYKSSNEKVDLVTTDYYAKELQFQKRIDEADRTKALNGSLRCSVTNNTIHIIFPKDFSGKEIKGQVVLYCPSDENKDTKQDFSTIDSTVNVTIPSASKGAFQVQVNCVVDNKTYYFDNKIFIQ